MTGPTAAVMVAWMARSSTAGSVTGLAMAAVPSCPESCQPGAKAGRRRLPVERLNVAGEGQHEHIDLSPTRLGRHRCPQQRCRLSGMAVT